MRADRLFGRRRSAQLVLFGQRRAFDRVEPADRAVRRKARALELAAIEARAFEEIFDLFEIERSIEPRLAFPGPALDLGIDHRHQTAPPSAASWAIASSPFEARKKPIGVSLSSMRWAMSPAVRARIGMARMRPAGASTSLSVAAI